MSFNQYEANYIDKEKLMISKVSSQYLYNVCSSYQFQIGEIGSALGLLVM